MPYGDYNWIANKLKTVYRNIKAIKKPKNSEEESFVFIRKTAFDGHRAIIELLSKVDEMEARNKRLEEARENANAACAKWEGLYYTELEKRRYFVTEYCPHCDTESTLMWSVEEHGYEIYCPVCGKKIMLCSMCGHHNDCDWTEESGCKMKKEV